MKYRRNKTMEWRWWRERGFPESVSGIGCSKGLSRRIRSSCGVEAAPLQGWALERSAGSGGEYEGVLSGVRGRRECEGDGESSRESGSQGVWGSWRGREAVLGSARVCLEKEYQYKVHEKKTRTVKRSTSVSEYQARAKNANRCHKQPVNRYTHMHVWVCVRACLCLCVCVCIYIHIYIDILKAHRPPVKAPRGEATDL